MPASLAGGTTDESDDTMRRQITLWALTGAFLASAVAAPALPAFADSYEVSHSARGRRDGGYRDSGHRDSGHRDPAPTSRGEVEEFRHYRGHGRAPEWYGHGAYRGAPRHASYRGGGYYYVPRGRRRYRREDNLGSSVLSGAIGAAIMYGAYRVYNNRKHRNRVTDEAEQPAVDTREPGSEAPKEGPKDEPRNP